MSSETDTPGTSGAIPPVTPIELDEPISQIPTQPEVIPTQISVGDAIPSPEISKAKVQNVELDEPMISEFDPGSPNAVLISLPSTSTKRANEVLDGTPNIRLNATKNGDKWSRTVIDSIGMGTNEDTFLTTLEDEKADFGQSVEFGNARFGSKEASFPDKQNAIYEGEVALLRTIQYLGLGSAYSVALYNTGIWLTFKPPTEEELVELYRQLTSDQIEMGRQSYGMVFAHTSSFVNERVCKFAMEHVYRIHAAPNEITPGNALNYIKAQDIPSLIWGFACTMFPQGFGYTRACMVNPEKCQEVITEKLNLRRIQVVNRAALTEYQKAHMSAHRGKYTLTVADLKRYETEMIAAQSHTAVINKGKPTEISFKLRSPSITEYIESGHRWIDDMVNTVEQVLGSSADYDDRNNLIELRSKATLMRQYAHWVSGIELGTNGLKEGDVASIEKVLNGISGDTNIREGFLSEVKKFIENSSVSVIGIPTYDCPSCGGANQGPEGHPHRTTLIPIDTLQLFSALLTQKYTDLRNR